MQNFVDLFPSLTNSQGEPLYGYIEFLKTDSTTPQNVLDGDNNNIGNLIITNEYGKISSTGDGSAVAQIFLQDEADYTIRYYEFIGNNFNIDDKTQFQLVKSLDYYRPRISVDIDGGIFVNTIQDLRNFDISGLEDGAVITLLGYYAAGDKPEVNYIWNANSTRSDEGGSSIQVNGVATGRFLMINRNTVDIRDWGVFGSETEEGVVYQTGRIAAALYYANQYSCTMIFPNIYPGGTWYGFDGGNYEINFCKVEANAYFKAKDGMNNYFICRNLESAESPLFYGMWHTVIVDKINSGNIMAPNSSITNLTADVIYVYDDGNVIRGNFNRIQLVEKKSNGSIMADDCDIISKGLIDCDITITNTEAKEAYFAEGYDYNKLTINGTTILNIDDWLTTSIWWKLKNRLNTTDFGDVKGRTFNSDFTVYSTSAFKIKNAIFDNFTSNSTNITLEDCKGSINFGAAALHEYNVTNSSISSSGTLVVLNGVIEESIITANLDIRTKLTAAGSTFNSAIKSINSDIDNCRFVSSFTSNTYISRNCIFESTVTGTQIDSEKCNYKNTLNWSIAKGTVNFNFNFNTLDNSVTVMLGTDASISGTIVNGSICNNVMTDKNKKLINFNNNQTYFNLDESSHSYSYENNTEYMYTRTQDFTIGYDTTATDLTFSSTVLQKTSYAMAEVNFDDWHFNTNKGIYFDIFSFGRTNLGQYKIDCYFRSGDDYIVPTTESKVYTYLAKATGEQTLYYYARNPKFFSYTAAPKFKSYDAEKGCSIYTLDMTDNIAAKGQNSFGMAQWNTPQWSEDRDGIESTGTTCNVKIDFNYTKL